MPSQKLVAVTAEFLVDSVDGLTAGGHISKEFVGIILLPIVGNAAGSRVFLHDRFSLKNSHLVHRTRHGCHCVSKGQAYSQPGSRCGLFYCKCSARRRFSHNLNDHRDQQIALFVIP